MPAQPVDQPVEGPPKASNNRKKKGRKAGAR